MKTLAAVVVAIATSLAANGVARAGDPTKFDKVGPDQLAFSIENMDRSVDPRKDFYRYASGGWLQRVERPERLASIGVFNFMLEHEKLQLADLFAKAAAEAPKSPRGSPVQQVGDLYRSTWIFRG
jgi:predicted metalloendopeptidase